MHIPVLLEEALRYLDPKPNENFVDATAGEGGHSFAILKRTRPNGKVLAIERDPILAKELKERWQKLGLGERLTIVCGNFRNLRAIVQESGWDSLDGVLFDLGLSSWHLEESGRGFSFARDEQLDMRYDSYDPKDTRAQDIINSLAERELVKIFRKYGDEPYAERIARAIVTKRRKERIQRTRELVELIETCIAPRRRRLHPATRVFQALRITVNNEFEAIRQGITQAFEILRVGGRIVVISFHSGEDRIAKHFFQEHRRALKMLTPKPIRPTQEETINNPRSRSARLRAAIKLESRE